MKKVILLSFVLLFMGACEEKLCVSPGLKSKLLNISGSINQPSRSSTKFESSVIDTRCIELDKEAGDEGRKAGVCYDGPLTIGLDIKEEEAHPDYATCKALFVEARKKCESLPPDPESMVQLSGSSFLHKGKVIIDGKPVSVKDLRACEKCSNCRELSPEEIK